MSKRVEKAILNPPNIDGARTLKPANQLLTPDPLWGFWKHVDLKSGKHLSTQLKDIYYQAGQAKLEPHVPAEIREHFATALNLIAYSWFYYPFTTQAELAAYTTVEKALKISLGFASKKTPSFSVMLTRAIDEGLLTEAGFPHMAGLPPVQPVDGKPTTRLELAKRIMLDARNTMAHGGSHLHPNSPYFVIICAELINQLFATKEASA